MGDESENFAGDFYLSFPTKIWVGRELGKKSAAEGEGCESVGEDKTIVLRNRLRMVWGRATDVNGLGQLKRTKAHFANLRVFWVWEKCLIIFYISKK